MRSRDEFLDTPLDVIHDWLRGRRPDSRCGQHDASLEGLLGG